MVPMNDFVIILFYKYVHIENPDAEMKWHREICEKLALKGRVIVSEEGINATLEGTKENLDAYIEKLKEKEIYHGIDFKFSVGVGDAFPKLKVKNRKEIVTSGFGDNIDPTKDTGTYLDPEEFHKWYEQGEDFVVIDMRNANEIVSGKFDKTIDPGLTHFRDLNHKIDDLMIHKDKKIVTVCTGGVRCEKASAFLKAHGFNDVYQLHGGMHVYMEKFPEGFFKGVLYVFDNRHTMTTADAPEIISVCHGCSNPSVRYQDCYNAFCGMHLIVCEDCADKEILCKSDCPQINTKESKIEEQK